VTCACPTGPSAGSRAAACERPAMCSRAIRRRASVIPHASLLHTAVRTVIRCDAIDKGEGRYHDVIPFPMSGTKHGTHTPRDTQWQ